SANEDCRLFPFTADKKFVPPFALEMQEWLDPRCQARGGRGKWIRMGPSPRAFSHMVQTSMAIREPGCSASAARIHTDMLARGEAGCCDRGHRGPWIAS